LLIIYQLSLITDFFINFYLNMVIKAVSLPKHLLCTFTLKNYAGHTCKIKTEPDVLGVPVSFEGFFAKKYIYFKGTLDYFLIKLFSIVNHNFFPFLAIWNFAIKRKKCLFFKVINSSKPFFISSYVLMCWLTRSRCIDQNKITIKNYLFYKKR